VFVRTRNAGDRRGDLWWTDVGTGEAGLLAEGDFAWPAWSPDGTGIAYVTQRNDEPFVGILDLGSGDHNDVAPGDFPVWSPDGRAVLLTRDNESVVAVELEGMTEVVVTEGCCASMAPDGRRLVVSRDS
jgi:Tol biopolymer transport system component